MKIAASALQLSASHFEFSQHRITERLRAWVGERPDFEGRGRPAARATVEVSAAGKAKQAAEAEAVQAAQAAVDSDPMLSLLKSMIEALTGRRVEVFDASRLTAAATETPDLPDPTRAAAPPAASFGVEYDRHESYSEAESTRFAAEGVVRTADGAEIRFSLALEMSRSYHVESDLSLRLGNARKRDPLVINFAGNAAALSDRTFSLDLDADGSAEAAHFLAPGSGFLVFDRNADGQVNDGRELFGAATGDGFAELAALDGDGNGWIDEADPSFAELRVWTQAANGADSLQTLRETGVGALAVSRVATPFELKDADNASLGAVRSTGIYLKEDGGAGTVQQIDLSV